MQASEILDYAQTNWSDYYKTVTEISINKKTQQPLVKSDFRMYDFDDIVKNLFPQGRFCWLGLERPAAARLTGKEVQRAF